MSITFTCTCGKRMRARDEMAARRTMCPACGRPVGIPSGQPTQRGAPVGPLSPDDRRRRVAENTPTVVVPFLNDPLRPAAVAIGSPGADFGALRYRAVELSSEGTPASVPAPRVVVPPVQDPPTYRVVQVADEILPPQRVEFRGQLRRVRRRCRSSRHDRPLERHWYECLAFPFLTWRWLLVLAVVLSFVTASVVSWIAEGAPPDPGFFFDPQSDFLLKWLFRALFAGAAFAFVGSYLYWVARSAATDEPPHGNWPAFDVRLLLRGAGCCLAALVAGPVELAVLGFYYWMECGDVTLLDGIILAELAMLGVGCGLFALAAAARGGRAADINPLRAFTLAQRLGPRGILLVLFTSAAVAVHGLLGLGAIQRMHLPHGGFGGWLLLTICWMSALFAASFVLRLLGRWCAEDGRAAST
jgi:hypothetical protein